MPLPMKGKYAYEFETESDRQAEIEVLAAFMFASNCKGVNEIEWFPKKFIADAFLVGDDVRRMVELKDRSKRTDRSPPLKWLDWPHYLIDKKKIDRLIDGSILFGFAHPFLIVRFFDHIGAIMLVKEDAAKWPTVMITDKRDGYTDECYRIPLSKWKCWPLNKTVIKNQKNMETINT